MGRKHPRRLRALVDEVARRYPEVEDSQAAIAAGHVAVDGLVKTNPRTLVRSDSSVVLRRPEPLRGERKLQAALGFFPVEVSGRIALDLGAAAGGFTRALLEAGAGRVYAVDAGHGQLLGSLRQDPLVVNLERTNLGELRRELVPEAVELITIDLSYLAVSVAVAQLGPVEIAPHAELVALVKPMFELGVSAPPSDAAELATAVERARRGVEAACWRFCGSMRSPVEGKRGAIEFFVHARRAPVRSRR